MRTQVLIALLFLPIALSAAPQRKAAPLRCGDVLSFQVLLDRRGFSSGEIDGSAGPNFHRALAAWQTTQQLPASGKPDCTTWTALNGAENAAALTTYTITEADTAGPFTDKIPPELDQQATLPALGYTSSLERIAERFHAAPALLGRLNPAAAFAAGQTIKVPGVTPFDADTKPQADPAAAGATITVSRQESSLRAVGADGTLLFYAPVTSGSERDPLPPGEWKVTGVSWHPQFNYNPDLFWDAKPGDTKATIKPGPNNPVGVVWIDISREHYGLHGTPEPRDIGHTASHGCVRLTNWDAARAASLVKAGTTVVFK